MERTCVVVGVLLVNGRCKSAKVQETDVENLKVGWHVWFMKDCASRFSVNPQNMSVEKRNPLVQYANIASSKIPM